MIVATAGHVDHGKTSLVKALTGIDTDRLEEERRRGLSIDLGFAHADLGSGAPIGFIDVPGHERFIRNMVAGVACIDLALLVVAADDGPMPQTVEHLAILESLGVPRCAVALTKIDRVAAARVVEAGRAIEALLAPGPFRGAPLFPVVATTGAGIDVLREHLRDAAGTLVARPVTGHFRLAVDRSFALAGAGLVVTGAVVAGAVRVDDALVVSPHGIAVRVRAIQIHGEAADQARAGQRCALNLASSQRAPVARGDWVVAASLHAPTDRLDVRLAVCLAQPKALAEGSAVQLHLAAASVTARVATLEGRSVEPGASRLAQLVLDRPIGALHGDRFILRDPTAQRTLGGGSVVDPFAPARGRARPVRLAQLVALAQPAHDAALAALLAAEPAGIDLRRFAQARNLDHDAIGLLRRDLGIVVIADRAARAQRATDKTERPGDGERRAGTEAMLGIAAAHWDALRRRIVVALEAAHTREPDAVGLTEPALAAGLGMRGPTALLHAALRSLLGEDGAVVRDGFCLRLAAHVPRTAAAEAGRFEQVRNALLSCGLRPPIVGDLAEKLGRALPALLPELVVWARRGLLIQVAKNRYFLPHTVVELAHIAAQLAQESADRSFTAAAYRDRSGLGRNLTIEVLEHLDRAGITRFAAGRRSIAGQSLVVT